MAETTVSQLAGEVGIPVGRLIIRLQEAGLSIDDGANLLTDDDKLTLLRHLRDNGSGSLVNVRRRRSVEKGKKTSGSASDAHRVKSPRIFISYSWDSEDHKLWVKRLAARLRTDGIEAILDQWELHPGDDITHFMGISIAEADFVLTICTPLYKSRADSRTGGVGYEGSIITSELYNDANSRKFIPVLRGSKWESSSPRFLNSRMFLDMRAQPDEQEENGYRDLLLTLYSRRESPPPIGEPPEFARK